MKEMVGGCCVCSDDRGWSENPLVYCDGQSCAVAVHQACYGIVTVPSGPWYCRKCESQERSARVRCELCPSRDGALKRTDNQGWAHVVCALYIPEVRFGNVTTMEPIILQLIPQERYSKTCYICQEMGKASRSTVGACMQCNKSGCKQQFHVTCAQQLGLLCEEAGNYLDNVKYCGYCQHHYSKLKKGGNVKTIPPYKPISHETNSSDGPSSPEKELEPPPTQQHSSGSGLGSTSGIKSTNRLPNEQTAGPPLASSSSSSKQRKSSGASKGSTNTSMAPGSTIMSGPGNTNSTGIPSQPSSIAPGLPGMNSMAAMSNVTGSSLGKTSSSSTSSSSKDKDKYNKNISKVSSTNKGHEKDPSNASASSSSSSSQRDKGSKSSKSSTSGGNSNIGVIGTTSSIVSHTGSNVSNPMLKESDPALMSSSTSSNAPPHSTTMKHQPDSGTIKQEKTLAQISSAAVSSARAASLSPAAIPTTLIIKPPQDHSGNSKDILSKETIAKFTTSNFTETIVVNSDSVFGANAPGNPGLEPIGSNTGSLGGNTGGPPLGPISVIESGSASANVKMNLSGENPYSGGSAGGAKKRKADARSTPTFTSGDIDINRDLIKDVAVSLVPLPLNKNDSIDPASISGIEKSIKKAKTEPNSPHTPTADPNLQNLNPNLLQSSHASNVISSSIKHQQQPNSPQLPPPTSQQQQQGQLHTPSLVVSVPLSTATVPGVNLPTSNSGSSTGISSSSSSTSSSGPTNTTSNVPNVSSGSNSIINTPNIVSPGQMPPGTSLYQQLTQRSGEQFMGASANRSSPVIQQQTSHVIQNPAHVILERQSPSMRSSPAIITSAGGPQQAAHSFGTSGTLLGMDLNPQPGNPVSVLQSISPVPMNAIQSTSSSPITMGGEGGGGGLKISYEAQTPNARIAALQEEEFMGRRSRSKSRERGSGGTGNSAGGGKTRTSKKRSLQQQQQQQQHRSSPSVNSGSTSTSSSPASSANNASSNISTIYARNDPLKPTTTTTTAAANNSRSSTPSNSHSSSHSNTSNNNQLNPTLNSSSNNSSHTNPTSGNNSNSNSLLTTATSTGSTIMGPTTQPPKLSDKFSQSVSSASSSASGTGSVNTSNITSSITTSAITSAPGTNVIEMAGSVSTSVNIFQSNHANNIGQQQNLVPGGSAGVSANATVMGNSNSSNSSNFAAGSHTDHGHGTPSSNNTSSINNSSNNSAVVVTHTSKKLRSSQTLVEIPSPSNSRTPDNSFGSNSSFSGGGGLKFSYEAQPTSNSITIGATSTIITPQATVKESPPSSPGSDSGMGTRNSSGAGNKRNRKLSTHSNVGGPLGLAGPPEAKESKLFQNGVVHASHMLGNQLNPNSTMAQKMSDQLSMEIETHTTFVEAAPQLVGPPFPGKQAVRPSNPAPTGGGGNSLSSMLTGSATATANGNTPQSLEQLLERQWEQGSQFLMEQAQHFDIASLLSCLHQLRSENVRLEEHVNNLIARRDHLLAVNARLAIPLNPAAMGGVGLGGGGGGAGNTGSGGGGSGNTGGSSGGSTGGGGSSAAGSQGQFNNMHGNGPHEGGGGSSTSTTTISSRNSRIQQHQSQNQQQQQSQSHFGSNTSSSNPVPLENGIDFRHSNSNHPNTNNSSIRHHSPSNQSCAPSSNATSNRQSSSSSGTGGGSISEPPSQSSHHPRASGRGGTHNSNSSGSGSSSATNTTSSNVFQVQQQTIYNTAHQIPLLLEHHQQEHHSQQHHPPLPSVQAAPHGAHHLRQTSPTVPSSRAHQSRDHNTSRVAVPDGANLPPSLGPPSSHSHHPVSSIHSSSQQPPPPAPSTLPPHHHITPPHHQVQSSGHPPPPPPPHVQQQRQRH
ncbi:protein AF-10 isoform X2 [Uranotaenia lowii]|uniref:protein AF-10 isoform X2 n=1 Tax=Uranotaenia lowii TaxID=190385 RepID=UPI00247894AD|nr:protein AF-10 isoform X2 [Uranotaenia lowii]